jgi:hypothetical protein
VARHHHGRARRGTFRVTYADSITHESDLLWGKGDRLVSRARGDLSSDFEGQCPRYESWTWRLEARISCCRIRLRGRATTCGTSSRSSRSCASADRSQR